jgi:hypothetical protein
MTDMTEMRSASAPIVTPREGGAASTGTSAPKELTDDQLARLVTGTIAATAGQPQLFPPGAAVAAEGVTATWRTNVQITALWTIDEVRNAFVHIDGVGWKKLYNGRDGAFSALVTLAAQARQTGRNVSCREEADGMIYEIYLW